MSNRIEPPDNDYDSLNDVVEFQKNMFNPGHYIGTGKVPPTVSAPGNALPLAISYFIGAIFGVFFGLFIFFLVDFTDENGKVFFLIFMLIVSAFSVFLGFKYLKKAKKYYKQKHKMAAEESNETVTDELIQRTCPNCKKSHDIDYPKCPFCKYDYSKMHY